MKKIEIPVQKEFCGECSLALLHFLKNLPGIESLDVSIGLVTVTFDNAVVSEEDVRSIVRENIEKMGYRLEA